MMTKLPVLTIKFDRFKLLKLILIGLVFFLMGGLFLFKGIEAINEKQSLLKVVSLMGLAVLTYIFSIPNTVVWLKKLIGKNEGLILSEKGFIDRSGSYNYGLIPWGDVNSISTYNVAGQDSISVSVLNKDKYREMGGIFNKLIFYFNVKYSGTPIHITSKSLNIDNEELAKICLSTSKLIKFNNALKLWTQ